MNKDYRFFRVVVALVCLYHLFLGIVLNSPVDVISWVAINLLGATHLPDATALFPARMLGTYLIVFGLGMGLVAWDPVKNRALLSLGAILVVMRILQRVLQADDLQVALGITSQASWGTVIGLLLIVIVLVVFRLLLLRDMKGGAVSA